MSNTPYRDQTADLNQQQLFALAKLYDPPDFVKNARREQIIGTEQQPDSTFGDSRHRTFPCTTAPATWVSALFFHTQKQAMDQSIASVIERRIDSAARFHGIAGWINHLKEAVAKNQPVGEEHLVADDFALVTRNEEGKTENHYPIRNAIEIKAACDYIRNYAGEFAYPDRQMMAERIMTKAASLQVALDEHDLDLLEKTAGHGTCSAEKVAEFLLERARAIARFGGDIECPELLTKMAVNFLEHPEYIHLPSQLQKLAGTIDKLDQKFGLQRFQLPNAEDVFFRLTPRIMTKLAEEHVAMTSGLIYRKTDLEKLALSDLEDLLGSDFAESVRDEMFHLDTEKLAEVARTLPRGDAEIFDRLAAKCQVFPVVKEAAHTGQKLSDADLAELSALHGASV